MESRNLGGAVAGHQRVRRVRLLEKVGDIRLVQGEDNHLHIRVVAVRLGARRPFCRLRDPLVGVGGRLEGAGPLKGIRWPGLLARVTLQGEGCSTDLGLIIAVNLERVVGLVLSTRALLLGTVAVVVAGVVLAGHRTRHQEHHHGEQLHRVCTSLDLLRAQQTVR